MSAHFSRVRRTAVVAALVVFGVPLAEARSTADPDAVLRELRLRACSSIQRAQAGGGRTVLVSKACAETVSRRAVEPRFEVAAASDQADGALVGRARIAESAAVALDVISYRSDGLIVGGLLCHPNDGRRHSTVIHVPGGVGGVFTAAAGDLVQTCIDWAALHGRTAFAPSLRGQDGGQGETELCLGEANDVVAAATMLRTLDAVDGDRLAIVGGSIGGCVALRAAPRVPNLAAVVAFVPPLSWKDLVQYHRNAWQPASEMACDGSVHARDLGGPAFADAFDAVICGHPNCADADYEARSPLPYVSVQTAPTLIVAAEHDNIVPLQHQLLWSLFRNGTGHPVSMVSVDKCDAPGTPAPAMDGLIVARDGFHLLPAGPISSGMLFLMRALDAIQPAGLGSSSRPTHKESWARSSQ